MSKILRLFLSLLLAIAVLALLFFTVVSRYIIHDNFIYLDIGGRILDGATPYIDYVETNFPTAHYLYILPVWLMRITDYDIITTFHIYMFLIALCSSVCVIYLSSRLPEQVREQYTVLTSAFAILILTAGLLFWDSFGQREHIFMLMFFPLIILSWIRWYPTNTIHPIAALILGFVAGISLTIKPHFFLLLAVLVVFDVMKRKTWRLFQYPEYQGVIFAGIFYIGFAILNWEATHLFLFEQLPETLKNYDTYGIGADILNILIKAYPIELLVNIGLFVAGSVFYRSKSDLSSLMFYFCALMFVSLIIVAIQGKGWAYHFIPFEILGYMGFAILGLEVLSEYFKYGNIIRVVVLAIMLGLIIRNIQLVRLVENNLWIAEEYSQEDDPILGIFTHTWFSAYSLLAERKNITTYLTAHPLPFELAKFDDVSEVYAGGTPYISDGIQKYLDSLQRDIETRQPVLIFIEEQ